MAQTFDRSQAIAFHQQRKDIYNTLWLGTQRFKKGARIGTEGLLASHAVIPLLPITVNFDVTASNFQEIGTGHIRTPVSGRIHGASPPIATDDTPNGLSRLR